MQMTLFGKNINLRLVDKDDAEFIVSVRSASHRTKHLSKIEASLNSQIKWIDEYKERESLGTEYYFIIEGKQGNRYGLVRVYDFKQDSFCWGSWIIIEGSPAHVAIESALMIYEFGFYRLGFKRVHFDVQKGNDKVVAFHLRLGSVIVGDDEKQYFFNYDIADYEKIKPRYSRYLPENNGVPDGKSI